jgi:phospholipase C
VNVYTNETITQRLGRGARFVKYWPLRDNFGWYNLAITVDTDKDYLQRLAGHVETGEDCASDPALAW